VKLTLGQVAEWMLGSGDFDPCVEVVGYSIDSRTVAAGELYFAVVGERLDGHDFVASALANGALAAVVSAAWQEPKGLDSTRLLRVPDPDCAGALAALQRLARAVRREWGGRVIAITGSVGKTTTKEAVAQVLSARRRVLKSQGNLNNGFGLPLQLLKLEPEHEVAVVELGMNHSGEIAALARIAQPDWAVVTNVAPVHLEFFADGIEGIARAKYELVEALPDDGIAVLNSDDEFVSKFGTSMGERAIYFGLGDCAEVRAGEINELGEEGIAFTVTALGERVTVQLHLLGRHNVHNALAAIAVGLQCGMTLTECAQALGQLRATEKRGEVVEWHGAKIINDCYNSNPRALNAMINALLAMPVEREGRHIVLAGEMLELGAESEALHRACGRQMAERGVDFVVGVRGLARALAEGAGATEAVFVETPEEAGAWLKANLRAGDVALLKASRGVKLERALDSLAD